MKCVHPREPPKTLACHCSTGSEKSQQSVRKPQQSLRKKARSAKHWKVTLLQKEPDKKSESQKHSVLRTIMELPIMATRTYGRDGVGRAIANSVIVATTAPPAADQNQEGKTTLPMAWGSMLADG